VASVPEPFHTKMIVYVDFLKRLIGAYLERYMHLELYVVPNVYVWCGAGVLKNGEMLVTKPNRD